MLVISIIDMTFATAVVSICWFGIGALVCSLTTSKNRGVVMPLYCFVFTIYYISAFIVSQAFHNNEYFFVSDASDYIERFNTIRSFDIHHELDNLRACFMEFDDSNAIFNTFMTWYSYCCNTLLGGGSVFCYTLVLTFFGVMCISLTYNLLLDRFSEKKSRRYIMLFALCSPLMIYSTVIIRDIVITFYFVLAYTIIKRPYSIINMLLLLLCMVMVWGTRLFTGIFFIVIPIYYIYINIIKTRFKIIGIILIAIVALVSIGYFVASEIYQKSVNELEFFEELSSQDGASGMSARLYNLPIGIKQIALTVFSQMQPLPPHGLLIEAKTMPQLFMGLLIFLEIYWPFVFFPLILMLFQKNVYKRISINDKLLFYIAILYIVMCTAHPDIRRMMPAYPVLFLLYVHVRENLISLKLRKKISGSFVIVYALTITLYIVAKV